MVGDLELERGAVAGLLLGKITFSGVVVTETLR
jgi:hypothetical protein